MKTLLAAAAIAAAFTMPAHAGSSITSNSNSDGHLIEQYNAYIGQNDIRNSNGVRLTQPWQIIRQDRANFHRYGLGDRADGYDRFFSSSANREMMERLLRNGWISAQAARDVTEGGHMIRVKIYEYAVKVDVIDY